MCYSDDPNSASLVVDLKKHAIVAVTRAVQAVEVIAEWLAEALRILDQAEIDESDDGSGNPGGKSGNIPLRR